MIVCLGGKRGVNIYQVGDLMGKKGWSLNSLQAPAGIHLCVTLRHVGKAQGFLADLRVCAAKVVEEVKNAAAVRNIHKKQQGRFSRIYFILIFTYTHIHTYLQEGRKIKSEGNAAIYGMSAT